MIDYLEEAAKMLHVIYEAQYLGRDLAPSDQIEIEIIDVVRPLAKVGHGQGYGLTAMERVAVERRAMEKAEKWLRDRKFETKDTSKSKPYDFEATRDGKTMFVEVKGTTSDTADSIAMTNGEVRFHRDRKGETILIIVSSIILNCDSERPEASGGDLEALVSWDIDTWISVATAFRVSRPRPS